ncbi:barstar family protein (plasmid) [Rhodococcus pyridinivorans]|uniref:Barstar family protein n=1 Tax=Rhodococcus pyridinivorans TaxID=103816 RepID=A0A419YYG7_9NOCA|nr:barstar family protein [Rhodococcus pyridinivorans]
MPKGDAVYFIDGRRIRSLEDFLSVVGEAVSGLGGYFGRNLDAFADCLTGGYGTPEDIFTASRQQLSRCSEV